MGQNLYGLPFQRLPPQNIAIGYRESPQASALSLLTVGRWVE